MAGRITHGLAIAWTVAITVSLLFVPVYGEGMSWVETTPSGRQIMVSEGGSQTLLDVGGPRILILLAIPLLFAGLPLLTKDPVRRRIALISCGLLMLAFAFVGGFSIGPFYYPTAVALLIAALLTRRAHIPEGMG